MTDLPNGRWSRLLVGHQWPTSSSLQTLSIAAKLRGSAAAALSEYAATLGFAHNAILSSQSGFTANEIQIAFRKGEQLSYELAEKNLSTQSAYKYAHQSVNELRTKLSSIAERGNAEIERIVTSAEPLPLKSAKILERVVSGQAEAAATAAVHSENVLGAIQAVLRANGSTTNARELTATHGLELASAFRSIDEASTLTEVHGLLEASSPLDADVSNAVGVPGSLSNVTNAGSTTLAPKPPLTDWSPPFSTQSATQRGDLIADTVAQLQPVVPVSLRQVTEAGSAPASKILGGNASQRGAVPLIPISPTNLGPPSFDSPVGTGSEYRSISTHLDMRSDGSPHGAASTHQDVGIPHSVESLSTASPEAAQHHSLLHTTQPVAPLGVPAIATPTPQFDVAHAAAAPPVDVQTMSHAAIQPVPATAAPMIQSPSTATPVTPSSLPGYGADVRLPATTPPAPVTPTAMPSSAPTTAHASGAHTHSAVVRQQPSASDPRPADLAERSYASAPAGASAAVTSTQLAATSRLQRFLVAVANQEPKLRWAVADRGDGTTILATDIAHGWIPPHVQIPVGLSLIQPDAAASSIEAMIAGTIRQAIYEPGQTIVPPGDGGIAASPRARKLAPLDDLAWSLIQATKWRDGLSRLAHTLAKAAAAKSGYLDMEVDLLREQLDQVARKALDEYLGTATQTIGNWQLLAAIDALISREKNCANYHLAWFEHSQVGRQS